MDYTWYYITSNEYTEKERKVYLIYSWDEARMLVVKAYLTRLKKAVKHIILACITTD